MANSKTIDNLFLYIAISTGLLPILFYFINFKRTKTQKGLGIIAVYCIYTSSINILFHLPLPGGLTFFLLSSFTLFEYLFFSYFFFSTTRNKSFQRLIILLSLLFTVFTVVYYFYAPKKIIDSIPIGIESILIIIFSFYYLFDQLKHIEHFFIYSDYSFWIVVGFIIYLAGSFFIYLFASQSPEAVKYWYYTDIFSTFKDVFFIIGMISRPKPPSTNSYHREQTRYMTL